MTEQALAPGRLTQIARDLAPRSIMLAVLGVVLLGAAFFVPDPRLGMVLMSGGLVLMWIVLLVRGLTRRERNRQAQMHAAIAQFVAHDAAPAFSTNSDGVLGYCNHAAQHLFTTGAAPTLAATFDGLFAAPAATLRRLQDRARALGAAREDIATKRGHMRLSVHQMGEDAFLSRLEDIALRLPVRDADAISLPMLTASRTGSVLFMNEALRHMIGRREASLDRIITDLPLRPGDIHEIMTANGRQRVQVAEVESAAGRREIYFLTKKAVPTGDWDLLDLLPVPLLKIAPEGHVLRANKPARDLLQVSEPGGELLSTLIDGLGRPVTDWLMEAAHSIAPPPPEILRASRTENEVHLQVILNRVVEGEQVTLIAVLNDATELKSLEAQFVLSQKMQAIGQLAGGVAHDFNNLLTAISGHCDLLLLRHDRNDPAYRDLIQINQNANRAAALVGQLLAFSRKQTLKPEIVDLRDTLSELGHLLSRLVGEKTTLTLTHDSALLPIRADKRQIEQVIMNLVVNARDAMPEGGEIVITTKNAHLREPYERDRARVPAGEYVLVSVTDKGRGIPPDKLQKIFEPFFTTKRTGEGTGLGLSTAYGIIKQTGGFIFVDSIVGEGTRFTLYLPIYDGPPMPIAAPPAPASPPRFEGGVVLLVEDEAPVRAFASRALRLRGYTVIEAENAEDALALLEDRSLVVDVFVTDVIMPGMDGPTWVSEALKSRPGVKVVFVSGYAEENFSEQQARIPNSVFLPKPFSLSQLTATVQDLL